MLQMNISPESLPDIRDGLSDIALSISFVKWSAVTAPLCPLKIDIGDGGGFLQDIFSITIIRVRTGKYPNKKQS